MTERPGLNIKRIPVGPLSTNCYVVWRKGSNTAAVIDPGTVSKNVLSVLRDNGLEVKAIINTHGHPDHIGGNAALRRLTGAPVYVSEHDASMLAGPDDLFGVLARSGAADEDLSADHLACGGDTLTVGDLQFHVLETPGHTPGGISLWLPDDGVVFTGDTLFNRGVGRTDFPGGHEATLLDSIHRVLFSLEDSTIVLPGHGLDTTIAAEKAWLGRCSCR